MVLDINGQGNSKITVTDPHKIARQNKIINPITKAEQKNYKIVFDKCTCFVWTYIFF